jgi:pyruvate dehydrogenase E1 component beta subunit
MKAADRLAAERSISAEVIDLRSLFPLDMETVLNSIAKTGRGVVATQAVLTGSFVNEIVARIQFEAFDELDAPIARVGAAFGISPQAEGLERAFLPDATTIFDAAAGLL